MPQIILKERTAHIVRYTFYTRDVNQYKNTPLSQFHQPPSAPFSEDACHQLLSCGEYCKVFKNSFFMGHHQEQSFSDVLQNKCS